MGQAYKLSQAVGAAALPIHGRDEAAKAFYLAEGDFLESLLEPMHLILSMKETCRRVTG